MYEKEIEQKMLELPENLKRDVLDYIEFLLKSIRSKGLKGKGLSLTGREVYQRYGENLLPLSYNTGRVDDVLGDTKI